MRDRADASVRAVIKRANAKSNVYGIGMERVAYTLATALGLPVRETYLETYENAPASVQLKVDGWSWWAAERAAHPIAPITNQDLWPLAVAFDIWLVNTDRNPGNMLLVPTPAGGSPASATALTSWLIDHGQCGLWPGWKMTGSGADRARIPDDPAAVGTGRCHAGAEQRIRCVMFPALRDSFISPVRGAALDAIKALGDDAIHNAVAEVPEDYITERQAAALAVFLQARRYAVDRVVSAYW